MKSPAPDVTTIIIEGFFGIEHGMPYIKDGKKTHYLDAKSPLVKEMRPGNVYKIELDDKGRIKTAELQF